MIRMEEEKRQLEENRRVEEGKRLAEEKRASQQTSMLKKKPNTRDSMSQQHDTCTPDEKVVRAVEMALSRLLLNESFVSDLALRIKAKT